MSRRFLVSAVTAIAVLAVIPFLSTHVAGTVGQGSGGRGAAGHVAPAGPVPVLNGHPDFTGIYDDNGIEDIRDVLAPDSEIKFTPAGAQKFKQQDYAKDPNSSCMPWGPSRMMCCTRHPIGFVMNPVMTLILTESQQTFRIVYMDGRPLPSDLFDKQGHVDPQAGGWMGFTRGRWERDALVTETVGADPRSWVDGHGAHPHSEKMRLTERYRMTDANTIEYSAVVDDAVYYQKPWTFLKTFKRMTGNPDGDRILGHVCAENEKDFQYQKATHPEGTGEGGRTPAKERGRGTY